MALKPLFKLSVILLVAALTGSACSPKRTETAADVHQIAVIDSLDAIGRRDSAVKYLVALKNAHKATRTQLILYYHYKAKPTAAKEYNLLADSALALIDERTDPDAFPQTYFNALTLKGEAYMRANNYYRALLFFYKARSIPGITDVNRADIATRIAGILYQQNNYLDAARSWRECYRLMCQIKYGIPQRMFAYKQGTLNNCGLAYEKAGKTDSAFHFYALDKRMIDSASRFLSSAQIAGATIVMLDNLGGLEMRRNNFDKAEAYLNRSLAIPVKEIDGIRIPPQLKLAEICLKTGRLDQALPHLTSARKIIDKYLPDNGSLDLEWTRLYALYLSQTNDKDGAYNYLTHYIHLRDSITKTRSQLFGININREFTAMQREQMLTDLDTRDKIRWIYLVAISVATVMALAIIFMVYRNLKRSKKSHRDTIRHNFKLRHTLEELEKANKNYSRIMRVMAHDLRNPLGGMVGIASMLLESEELGEENSHMLQLLKTTGMHSMDMINELLKSGLSDDNEKLELKQLDLKDLLFDSVELLQFRAREKQQEIVFLNEDGTPKMAKVNYEKMWRVFNNLIVNAIKFSYPKTTITVSVRCDRKNIIIAVADQGIGIPDSEKETVFEMFTEAKKPGTNGEQPFGLGLSISKRIVDKHRGKIWFESENGKGTTFFISLPASV